MLRQLTLRIIIDCSNLGYHTTEKAIILFDLFLYILRIVDIIYVMPVIITKQHVRYWFRTDPFNFMLDRRSILLYLGFRYNILCLTLTILARKTSGLALIRRDAAPHRSSRAYGTCYPNCQRRCHGNRPELYRHNGIGYNHIFSFK